MHPRGCFAAFVIDRQRNDAPLGLGAATHQSPHPAGDCPSAAPLPGLSSHLSPHIPCVCASFSTHGCVHLYDGPLCCVIFLAGLAKPMGLVEGPGGLGQGGAAATLGEDSRDAEGKYEEYGYNAQLSDRISLDRSIPDYRPKKYTHFLPSLVLYILPPSIALHPY